MNKKIVLGHIVNPYSDKRTQFIKEGAIVITQNKKQKFVISEIGKAKTILKKHSDIENIVDHSGSLIMPPFFDMHFHWVQDDVREMPKDNLLNWLEKYTFPAEAKFNNKTYAKGKAKKFFKKLARNGTLGGACYSSIHEHALDYAFDYAQGDFVIGNVLMTINSPKNLTQEKKEAQQLAIKLAKKYKEKYCLTPRFAIATDPETMKVTAAVADKNKSFKQTHLSETENEINFVKSIYKDLPGFEKVSSYTEIYQKVGMLGKRSIMGHGIHLGVDELDLLKKTDTVIAHCPTSNAPKNQLGLGSGLFNFKRVEKKGIRWALGSDIGGGPYLSMFDVIQSFVEQNKKAKVIGATYKKGLYRATLAGAQVLGVAKERGNLEIGKDAQFIVTTPVKVTKLDTVEDVLKRLISRYAKNRPKYKELLVDVINNGESIY